MTAFDSDTCGRVPVHQALAVWPALSQLPHHIDMSQTSSSSSFRSLFDIALRDYAKETGTDLDDHPLAKELQICDSVDSISTVLRKQAQRFHESRGEDGKIMKSLKSIVHVLYDLSNGGALGKGIGTVCSNGRRYCQCFVSDMCTS
jgi:hypothetical protein